MTDSFYEGIAMLGGGVATFHDEDFSIISGSINLPVSAKCSYCGRELKDNDACHSCGAPVEESKMDRINAAISMTNYRI